MGLNRRATNGMHSTYQLSIKDILSAAISYIISSKLCYFLTPLQFEIDDSDNIKNVMPLTVQYITAKNQPDQKCVICKVSI